MMKELKEQKQAAGNLKEELQRVREQKTDSETVASVTVGYSPFLSLFCC